MRIRIVALLLCVALSTIAAPAQNRMMTLDDYSKIVSVSQPAFSPDGASVVVVVSRQDYQHDRRPAELVSVDVASGATRPLTFERTGLGEPSFSPDGTRLAFIANDDEHHGQIWVMPLHGGDARRVTGTSEGVQQFAWRPNGESMAYVTTDAKPKKSGPAEKEDLFQIGDDDMFVDEAPRPSHLWIVGADGSNNRRLTSGSWSLPVSYPPSPPAMPLSWSADGKEIMYGRVPNAHSADAYISTLYAFDLDSGKSRKLTEHTRFEGFGVFAPSGDRFAYIYSQDGDPNNDNDVILHTASGEKDITRALDHNMFRAQWMPSGDALLVGANGPTAAAMWLQPLDGGSAKQIDTGGASVGGVFWTDAAISKNGSIAFTGSTPSRPPELYYLSSPDAKARRLTNLNAAFDNLSLAKPEVIEWTNDGFKENGILWTPPNAAPRRKLPLVLLIHGGPQAASLLAFNSFAQIMAARGFLVFEPNYRGSDNLGNAYIRGIFNDAGAGPGRDVMAGVAAVRARGIVDDARIAVSGWSYGGYMTSWLIGHYHIWKTAVSGAAVNNLVDEYNLADNGIENAFTTAGFASPWKSEAAMRLYREQSPITSYAQIRTPTLILTDLRDSRVAPTQSFELYHALKDRGVYVEFWAWPIAGHNPGDPVRVRQRLQVWRDWLSRWLK